ncbi:MAG TPA: GNAT family N-acetyltransferase [Burkholderiaceae bacterium]
MTAFRISTNQDELDIPLIHRFLSEESYWKKGVSLEIVRKSLAHSMCFGGYIGDKQIAFGRVITDYADFGYLRDVFVLKEHRGKGYGKLIVQEILSHPELCGVNFMLGTEDAHSLYEQFGFTAVPDPKRLMRRLANVNK